MKINDIETSRLSLRGFTKEDALWAYSIWNNPEMGQYLPDEEKEERWLYPTYCWQDLQKGTFRSTTQQQDRRSNQLWGEDILCLHEY